MPFEIKSFILGKENEPDGRQDAMGIDEANGLFAVADGVSNSFRPDLVAKRLCQNFTNLEKNVPTPALWNLYSEKVLLPDLNEYWIQEVSRYMDSLEGRILRHATYNLERWGSGASTFCGVNLREEDSLLRYYIIGDSTLFVTDQSDRCREYNTISHEVGEDGAALSNYSNVTEAVTSSLQLAGKWETGEIPLEGVKQLALMTDGMAKWFQGRIIAGEDPFAILWELENIEEFRELADFERSHNHEMDDDLTVILIKLKTGETKEKVIWLPTLYSDEILVKYEIPQKLTETKEATPATEDRENGFLGILKRIMRL